MEEVIGGRDLADGDNRGALLPTAGPAENQTSATRSQKKRLNTGR